jgi:NADH-quinone oxidoreductase subunit J
MTSTAEIIAFVLLCIVTLGASLAAVSLRNLVHCGLNLALAFIGIGGFYLLLGAEFVGFVQLLVYVGAVAILIMFVILLSRPAGVETEPVARKVVSLLPGLGISLAVLAVLVFAIGGSPSLQTAAPEASPVSIESIGLLLVSSHLLPLQITGVLLTAALIGGVLFALKEEKK